MKKTTIFRGICPAVLSPCDENDVLDEDAFSRHVEHLYADGIHGLYLTGFTGQGYSMSMEDRKTVTKLGIDLSKGKGYTISHVGTQDTRSSCILAEYAASCGTDAIAAIPPLLRTHEQICSYYKDLSKAVSGLPVFVYHIPDYTHYHPTFAQFREYLEIEGVVGLKYTDPDLHMVRKLLNIREDIQVLYGRDEQLLGGFQFGAQAGVGSTYNAIAKTYVDLWNAFESKNWDEATRLQNRVTKFFTIAENFQLMQAIELVLQRRNILKKGFRRPFISISGDNARKLEKMLIEENFI